jgi:hypothetical protein
VWFVVAVVVVVVVVAGNSNQYKVLLTICSC